MISAILIFCIASAGLADELSEQRVWTGTNGSSFTGHFLRVDEKTGEYGFADRHGKYIQVDPDNLSEKDRQWIQQQLKLRTERIETERRAQDAKPLLEPNALFQFTKGADLERSWTNREGKTITATIVGFDQNTVNVRVSGRQAKIPLQSLTPQDQAAACWWTGTTNSPAKIEHATLKFKSSLAGQPVGNDTIELCGNYSRITSEYRYQSTGVEVKSGRKVSLQQHIIRTLTTNHLTGTYQKEQTANGKVFGVTGYGKWKDEDYRGIKDMPPHLKIFEEHLHGSPLSPGGEWPGRYCEAKSHFGEKQQTVMINFVRFPDSSLASATYLLLTQMELSATSFLAPYIKGELGVILMNDLAPTAFNYPDFRGQARGQCVIALDEVSLAPLDPATFQV